MSDDQNAEQGSARLNGLIAEIRAYGAQRELVGAYAAVNNQIAYADAQLLADGFEEAITEALPEFMGPQSEDNLTIIDNHLNTGLQDVLDKLDEMEREAEVAQNVEAVVENRVDNKRYISYLDLPDTRGSLIRVFKTRANGGGVRESLVGLEYNKAYDWFATGDTQEAIDALGDNLLYSTEILEFEILHVAEKEKK
jgi:hypothetical protein